MHTSYTYIYMNPYPRKYGGMFWLHLEMISQLSMLSKKTFLTLIKLHSTHSIDSTGMPRLGLVYITKVQVTDVSFQFN